MTARVVANRRIALLFVCIALLGGCASSATQVDARTYVRPEATQIRLKTLDVAVVVAGPPRVAEEKFAIASFPPPELDAPIARGQLDQTTMQAVATTLEHQLDNDGFALNFDVDVNMTLKALLAGSTADGVLIVRAVPVDRFIVDVGQGSKTIETALGRERIRDFRPQPREGRLLVGQAFLYDRATGLRLWSKQAPDYPEGGRLTPTHPFLQYGYVGTSSSSTQLAHAAADGFVRKMFEGFPSANAGDPAARAKLNALDIDEERRAQSFRDETHVAVEVGASWGLEPSRVEGQLFETSFDISNGAITPVGIPRVAPRVSILTTSGWAWTFVLPLGMASSGFGRTYHVDNPAPDLREDRDQTARVKVNKTTMLGVEAHLGPTVRLSDLMVVVPRGGLFVDVWSIDATPGSVIRGRTRVRLGAALGSDLMFLPASDGWFFGRVGADARIGADTGGPFILGFALSGGVGILL